MKKIKVKLTFTDFNSHAHVERDELCPNCPLDNENFNSHAHVERDRAVICINIGWQNFNSHAHVERDVGKEIIDKEQAISTHTLTWSVTLRASQQPCRT